MDVHAIFTKLTFSTVELDVGRHIHPFSVSHRRAAYNHHTTFTTGDLDSLCNIHPHNVCDVNLDVLCNLHRHNVLQKRDKCTVQYLSTQCFPQEC